MKTWKWVLNPIIVPCKLVISKSYFLIAVNIHLFKLIKIIIIQYRDFDNYNKTSCYV